MEVMKHVSHQVAIRPRVHEVLVDFLNRATFEYHHDQAIYSNELS